MKKTRLLLSTVIAFVMACSVGVLAVGCNEDDPEPTTYKLTYEKGENEEGTVPEEKSYAEGATVELAAGTTFTKEGYTFTKWLDGTTEYDGGATFTMPARNVTLKAKWEEKEPETNTDLAKFILGRNEYTLGATEVDDMGFLYYEATFTGDPNTNYTFTLSYPSDEINHDVTVFLDELDGDEPFSEEDTVVLKTSGEGTILFVLSGWTYDPENYNADEETVILTVSKGGEVKYRVSFYDNLAYYPMGSTDVTVTEGGTVSADDIPQLTSDQIPEGKQFAGWYIAESEGSGWYVQWSLTATEFTTATVVNSNMVVGALFEDKEYNDLAATELYLGKNHLAVNANEVDPTWNDVNRKLTFSGTAGENYTISLLYPELAEGAYSSVSILLNGTNVSDYFGEDENSLVLKMPQTGSVNFVLNCTYYSEDENSDLYKLTLQIHGGGCYRV